MFDNELMWRKTSDGNLTATMAGAYLDLKDQAGPLEGAMVFPGTVGNADNTCVATVTYSDDGSTAKEVLTIPTINNASLVTNKITKYTFPILGRRYVKLTLTVAGTTPNFGAVQAGIEPAGRYDKNAEP